MDRHDGSSGDGHRAGLLLVNGPPGAGKTTLGRRLAMDAGLPFFSKDMFKDALFDTLGISDRAWSAKVGQASVGLLLAVARSELDAGRAVVLENAFVPRYDRLRFASLLAGRACDVLEIWCWAPTEVLYERFRARSLSGDRHPGHVDDTLSLEGFKDLLGDRAYAPLDLGGELLDIDTTDFDAIDFRRLDGAVADFHLRVAG